MVWRDGPGEDGDVTCACVGEIALEVAESFGGPRRGEEDAAASMGLFGVSIDWLVI